MRELLCGEDQTDYRGAKTAAMIVTQLPQLLRPTSLDLKQFALKRIVKTRLRLVKDQTRDINLLHNHFQGISKKGVPLYQFTAIDIRTRIRFLAYGHEKSFSNAWPFMVLVLL